MTLPNEKIAHMTNGAKNRPQDGFKNRPDIIKPVCLRGVITEGSLRALLMSKGQTAWCSRVRLRGLLLLIDYMLRHIKRGRISMSADLAHQFVSKLPNSVSGAMITEPLFLLFKIGILDRIHPAVFVHIKTSTVYCFAYPYCNKQLLLKVVLTPKLAQKRVCASDRREQRLNLCAKFRVIRTDLVQKRAPLSRLQLQR